jgi:tetratricopeptide (TPR) repeat protein
MESGAANLLHMLEDRVRSLCEEEKWGEARHASETAVGKAREMHNTTPEYAEELALSLEVKGDLARQMGEFEEAKSDYLEAVGLLSAGGDYLEELGRLSASLAVIWDHEENSQEAKASYEASIDYFSRLDPPAVLDIADLSNNLAFLYEEEDNFDRAETLFLNALKTCHEELGRDSEETASICNNLGALYQKAGYHEQAQEMHKMALSAREASLGKEHLDTGQSHANLAASLADSNHFNQAREQFEKAISVYEKYVSESKTDYATVVSNYLQFLKAVQDEKTAAVVEKRASKMLKKA